MALQNILRPFRQAMRWALVSLVAALLVLMTVQVVMRYGFNSSLLWAEEICRYMLIWLSFLAAVLAFERGEIAALTFLSQRLARVPALLLASFCTLLSLALCLLLVWYGWIFAERAGGSVIPAMRILLEGVFGPQAPTAPGIFWVYVSLPVGMALMALRLFADLALCVAAIPGGRSLAEVLNRDQGEFVE